MFFNSRAELPSSLTNVGGDAISAVDPINNIGVYLFWKRVFENADIAAEVILSYKGKRTLSGSAALKLSEMDRTYSTAKN